jgi:type II secretory pathway pseudopilin PulG
MLSSGTKHKEAMQLAQGTRCGERGFAMAALLVALAVMAVVMSALLPIWRTLSIREKEEELVWRGQQYDRAIQLYRKKTSAPGAPSLDVLVNGHFLRQKFRDPITNGDFELIGVSPTGTTPGVQQPKLGFGQLIGGVRSKSKARSFRALDGKKTYAEWQFTYVPWRPADAAWHPGPRRSTHTRPANAIIRVRFRVGFSNGTWIVIAKPVFVRQRIADDTSAAGNASLAATVDGSRPELQFGHPGRGRN